MGSTVSVEATIGTPVRAAARAVARSPWPSWAHSPMTPIGAMNSGAGKRQAEQFNGQIALCGADEHARDQTPPLESLAVGPLRALVAGPACDV